MKYQLGDRKDNLFISTDKEKLDITAIHQFLTNAYWAKGRTVAQIEKSIENSICFGLYKDNEQIGFTRVLTDKVVFAYLMDVFILEKHRGKGYSKFLLDYIFNYPDFQGINKWFLATKDAHKLYKQFGFIEIPNPVMYMEKVKNN